VNCHAEYKLVGTKLSEIFSSDHSYLFLKTNFTSERRSLVKIVLRNKYSYLRSKISGNFVPTRCITIENSVEPQSLQSLPNHNDSFCYQNNSTPNNTIQNDINNLDLSYNDIHVINQNFYYHQNFKEQIEDEFNRTLNEFEHIEPFNRPLLPKQQSSKKLQ
jgi:hypothetical protein